MKRIISLILVTCALLLCLSGCINTTSLPEEMPDDFSFYIKWGTNGYHSYRSSTGELSKWPTHIIYSGIYKMPEEELKTVYNLIYDLNVESYDDELNKNSYKQVDDGEDYFLMVCANGVEKTISASSASGIDAGKTIKAKKFFDTMKTIIETLKAKDEWKILPEDCLDPVIPTSLPEKMPENFSFSVSWDGNYYNSNGTLEKFPTNEGKTIYIMSQEELETVYKLIYDLNIESYDDVLDPLTYQEGCPPHYYYLEVNANGISKTVAARGVYIGSDLYRTPKTQKYLSTIEAIAEILESTDEWNSLPDYGNVPTF